MNRPKKDVLSNTQIDLGEDLLKTSLPPKVEPKLADENLLKRGEILMRENLLDDAKRVFWKIIRTNPENIEARKFLEEIQEKEIKSLLATDIPKNKLLTRRLPGPLLNEEGISPEIERLEKSELRTIPDLFSTKDLLDLYLKSIMKRILALGPRDRVDIGIAYLEMGIYEISEPIFETVVRYAEYKAVGLYLLGLSLLLSGREIEATIKLAPYIRDVSIPDSKKIDFLYLMGRAFERLNDNQRAKEFYQRVRKVNPRYGKLK